MTERKIVEELLSRREKFFKMGRSSMPIELNELLCLIEIIERLDTTNFLLLARLQDKEK